MKQYTGNTEWVAFLLFLCVPGFYAGGIALLYESWHSVLLADVGLSLMYTFLGLATFFAGIWIYNRCEGRLERTAFCSVAVLWIFIVLAAIVFTARGMSATDFTKTLVCMGFLHAIMILRYAFTTPIKREKEASQT